MTGIPRVALGDLVTITGGGTPLRSNPAYFDGDIPWVTPKDMKTQELCDSQVRITERGLRESATKLVPPNSVLVVVRSGVLKHSVPIAINRVPVALNQDMKALSTGPRLQPGYLAHYLRARTPEILRWVRAATHGAGDNFPVERLRDLELPLPPLAEQQRVAAILDRADGLRGKGRQAVALLDALVQSIFIDMFGPDKAIASDWPSIRLGEVSEVQGGLQVTSARAALPVSVPYLRVANVHRGSLDLSEIKTMQVSQAEFARTQLKGGDLLVVEGHGNAGEIGRCALWDGSIEGCTHQNHLIRVRVNLGVLLPVFAAHYVNSPHGRRWLLQAANTTSGLNTISVRDVAAVPLVQPPLSQQRCFASLVESIDRQRTTCRAALAAYEGLFASLQHRAFRGEL